MRLVRGLLLFATVAFAVACGVKSLPRPPRPEGAPAPEAKQPAEGEPCPDCVDGGTLPPRIPE